MIETYAASQAADSLASGGASKEGKQVLVPLGCAVIVILAIVDCVLLYLWLTAPPLTTYERKAEMLRKNPDQDYDYSGGDPPLEDFPDSIAWLAGGQSSAARFCVSSACTWLEAYLDEDIPDAKEPCDDFYAHVCAPHRHSVYAQGRAMLMVALKDVLLETVVAVPGERPSRPFWQEHAVLLEHCLDHGQSTLSAVDANKECEGTLPHYCPSRTPEAPTSASDKFFRANPNATVDDFAAFIKQASSPSTAPDSMESTRSDSSQHSRGPGPASVPEEWTRWACRWVSLAARCHFLSTTEGTVQELHSYQRIWKAIYFAPFMGRSAQPLLQLVYQSPPGPRLQMCLSIMADAFEEEVFAAVKEVLSGTIDDLDTLVSQLGWDARQAMRKFFRFKSAQDDVDSEYLAFARGSSSGDQDDIVTELLGPIDAATNNMRLFSSEARLIIRGGQRRLLVAPGLLGLLVNVSSSVEAVLVPAAAAPVLRAMLADRWFEGTQEVAPGRLVSSVAQCLSTRLNMSDAASTAAAAESVILEPLLLLYRKRLADTEGSGTLLHPSYTNGQLFFVLWALRYCGEEEGAALVNAVAKNSGRFAKAFQCKRDAAMFSLEKCPLNYAA